MSIPNGRHLARVSWPVRTERLVLRPAEAPDGVAVWEFRRRPEVAEWITSAPAERTAFLDHFAEPGRLAETLVAERDGTIVGDLMLRVGDAWAQREVRESARATQAELGWTFHPDHQGHGYATEAVTALLGICFDVLGLRRVTAECFADNAASARLMERVGMRREAHTVRDSRHRTRGWLDGYGYALLADEWRAGPAASGRSEAGATEHH